MDLIFQIFRTNFDVFYSSDTYFTIDSKSVSCTQFTRRQQTCLEVFEWGWEVLDGHI
jgi:hypothetical protein